MGVESVRLPHLRFMKRRANPGPAPNEIAGVSNSISTNENVSSSASPLPAADVSTSETLAGVGKISNVVYFPRVRTRKSGEIRRGLRAGAKRHHIAY